MSRQDTIGILTGLVFVTVFLTMIACFHGLANVMQAPPNAYELAGSSRSAK